MAYYQYPCYHCKNEEGVEFFNQKWVGKRCLKKLRPPKKFKQIFLEESARLQAEKEAKAKAGA